MERLRRFNNWFAVWLGNMLSSIAFFYVCVVLDAIELGPVIAAHDVIVWCTYLSQTVIQLIALPILGVMQRIGNDNHATTHAHHERHAAKIDRLIKDLEEIKESQKKEIEWIGVLLRSEITRRERESAGSAQPKRKLS
ncbi:MAG: hypothetical protein KGI71_06065 [Patescibacteria group bacterium]|nr:hypothetical protein [Patescibacteria group bacterium]